jgi:hypothetical protein
MPKEATKLIDSKIGEPDDRTLEEKIRTRAYQLYEARGHEDGHDWEDWLSAEAEITTKAA